jgi:transposase
MPDPLYAGIDVSKDWCDVALEAGNSSARFDQNGEGRNALIAWLTAQAVTHVVLEASGVMSGRSCGR